MIIEVRVGDRPISYSAYDLRTDCAKQFQLKREIKVPETPGVYFPAGDAVHIITAVLDWLMTAEEGAASVSRKGALAIALGYATHPGLAIAFEELSRSDDEG